MDIYFVLWVIPHYYHCLFYCFYRLGFDHFVLFHVGSCDVLTCLGHFLDCLTSSSVRYSRLILYFSCPSWNQSLSQVFLVPLIRVWYLETKIWVLGMLTAMSMSFTFTLSQQIKLENMICMHTYIYSSIHLSIYLSKIYEFILIPPIVSFILAFSLCFFVTPFSNSEKTTLIIYKTFTCLINPNIHIVSKLRNCLSLELFCEVVH